MGTSSWIQRGPKYVGPYSGSDCGNSSSCGLLGCYYGTRVTCAEFFIMTSSLLKLLMVFSPTSSHLQSGWLQGHQLCHGRGQGWVASSQDLGPHANLHTVITSVYQVFPGQKRSFYLFPQSIR